MRTKHILLLILIPFILSAVSCQPRVTNDKKTIVVTYSVLGSVVKELVGEKANVVVPMPNGLDPHEWEPSAKDIETINKADLVIENGLGLEAGLGKTLDTARKSGVKFFTASEHINVRYVGPGEGIPTGDPSQAIGAPDPHMWTDPLTIRMVVSALAPALLKDLGLDVNSQASVLEKRLDDLNKEIASIVEVIPLESRKLVTGHESLGYFAQRYNFTLAGVIVPSLSSQAQVSAADLAALKKVIADYKVKVIFTEVGTSSAVARAIGDETGVQVVELPTHAVPADGSYFTFMRNMANMITSALK